LVTLPGKRFASAATPVDELRLRFAVTVHRSHLHAVQYGGGGALLRSSLTVPDVLASGFQAACRRPASFRLRGA